MKGVRNFGSYAHHFPNRRIAYLARPHPIPLQHPPEQCRHQSDNNRFSVVAELPEAAVIAAGIPVAGYQVRKASVALAPVAAQEAVGEPEAKVEEAQLVHWEFAVACTGFGIVPLVALFSPGVPSARAKAGETGAAEHRLMAVALISALAVEVVDLPCDAAPVGLLSP